MLNLARPLEFFFLLLQRDVSFLDGLLQQLIALFELPLEFFGTEPNNVGDHYDDDAEITVHGLSSPPAHKKEINFALKSLEH